MEGAETDQLVSATVAYAALRLTQPGARTGLRLPGQVLSIPLSIYLSIYLYIDRYRYRHSRILGILYRGLGGKQALNVPPLRWGSTLRQLRWALEGR